MASFSKFSSIQRNSALVGVLTLLSYRIMMQLVNHRCSKTLKEGLTISLHAVRQTNSSINKNFRRRLLFILKILFPNVFCREVFWLFFIVSALCTRTWTDLWMIKNNTAIESSVVSRKGDQFCHHVSKFLCAIPAVSMLNSSLKYSLDALRLCFLQRLSEFLYVHYLRDQTFFRINLEGKMANVDQVLTGDVDQFCTILTDLIGHVVKPSVDLVVFLIKLVNGIGLSMPCTMLLYFVSSGFILTRLRQPSIKLNSLEQLLNAELSHLHSRLITNCEEIAFYHGDKHEELTMNEARNRMIEHSKTFSYFKLGMGFIDNMIAKYMATALGFIIVGGSLLTPRMKFADTETIHSQRLKNYYENGRILMKMSEAVGRIVLAGRELTKLATFTHRVANLIDILINDGNTVQPQIVNDVQQNGDHHDEPKIIIKDKLIKFQNVPITTPNGKILIESLNFEVNSGMNVIVCGPNGCGKSSLFRILGGLWPLSRGILTKPPSRKLFYIPQRPYMPVGTLKDQIIYPDDAEDMMNKNVHDSDLAMYLNRVQLTYLLEREGGWNSRKDWMDVLSGGEKQRIAMARVFYHKPQFAILDECTSAVSVDVEGAIYEFCKQEKITLFTVSHRKSLWKYHDFCLCMDNSGGYKFDRIENMSAFGS